MNTRINSTPYVYILLALFIVIMLALTVLVVIRHIDSEYDETYQLWVGKQGIIDAYVTFILKGLVMYVLILAAHQLPQVKSYVDNAAYAIKMQIKNQTFDIINNLTNLTHKLNHLL